MGENREALPPERLLSQDEVKLHAKRLLERVRSVLNLSPLRVRNAWVSFQSDNRNEAEFSVDGNNYRIGGEETHSLIIFRETKKGEVVDWEQVVLQVSREKLGKESLISYQSPQVFIGKDESGMRRSVSNTSVALEKVEDFVSRFEEVLSPTPVTS